MKSSNMNKAKKTISLKEAREVIKKYEEEGLVYACLAQGMAARFLLDVCNFDPCGAGRQYPPDVITKVQNYVYEVMSCLDDQFIGLMYDENKHVIRVEDVANNEDYWNEDMKYILEYLSMSYERMDSKNEKLTEAYKDAIRSVYDCNENYFQLELPDITAYGVNK